MNGSGRPETGALSAIRWDERGLVPAIVQDDLSKEVLMLAYMNEEALRRSLETGETWFWSRSRGELWHKGATSGNTQRIVSIRYDCDGDALLVRVRPNGPACHTGTYSCFTRPVAAEGDGAEVTRSEADGTEGARPGPGGTEGGRTAAADGMAKAETVPDRYAPLGRLEEIIARRHMERPEGSYTTYLFEKGLDKILKKVGEETSEVIIAAKNPGTAELRSETADLLYHLMVLMRERGLSLDEVLGELDRRHGPAASDRPQPSDRPGKKRTEQTPPEDR